MNNDQLARAQVLDINKSFLVQAPAGSGKTSILVQRFLSALAVADSGPEEIIAITFTRKAAAEMRERILNALQAAMQPAPETEYELKIWQLAQRALQRDQQAGWQILNNPARLKIQTIDSLCASITKQMPILSRFGAQPQIEQNPEYLYEAAVDHMFTGMDHDDHYPCTSGLFTLLKHLDNDRVKIKKLLVQMLRCREHWLPILAEQRTQHNLRQALEKGLLLANEETLEQLSLAVPDILDVSIMSHEEPHTVKEWLIIIDKLLTQDGTWRKCVTERQGFPAPSKAKNKEEKQQLQACKDAMHAMLEQLQQHEEFRQHLVATRELPPLEYTDQQWEIVYALVSVLPVLAAQLTLVFRDQGQVDFIAVALAASEALQATDTPSDLSLALDCKIKHILVDEFQDTSHTQFRLLEQLTSHWFPGDGHSLFLVGDPMQSIYRFRQAEVGLFLKAKDQGISNIKLDFVQLKVNFRSSAAVINWINRVFLASFPQADNKTLGAISYMAAIPGKDPVQCEPAVECISVSDDVEATVIVDIIKSCQQQPDNPSIAILVRAKSHLSKILPALRAANIAYQGLEIENLSRRSIIQDLLSLTQAILHLDNRIAWLASLRAPWCGLSLQDLQLVANDGSTILANLQAAQLYSQLSEDGAIRLRRFVAVMNNALAYLGYTDLDTIVECAFEDLGGYEILCTVDEIDAVHAYFALLTQHMHNVEIYQPDFLAKQLERLFLDPKIKDKNAVQIMSMHKSKGLEFDVVIIPGLHKSTRPSDQQLLLLEQRDYQHNFLLLAPIRAAEDVSDPIYKYLAWCELQRAEYESLRQLYVAMTRARKQIYCLADVKPDASPRGMLDKIWTYVADEFKQSPALETYSSEAKSNIKRLAKDWFDDHTYPMQIEPQIVNTEYINWQPNWVNQAGTILHRILWNIAKVGLENMSATDLSKQNDILHKQLQSVNLTPTEQAKAQRIIHQSLQNVQNDDFAKTVLSTQHKESYAEWPLTIRKGHRFEQVRLDRLYVDQNDVMWLVDYKLVLEAENLPQAIQSYTPQILYYTKLVKILKPNIRLISGLYFPLQSYWHQVC